MFEANVNSLGASKVIPSAVMGNGQLDIGRMRPIMGTNGKSYVTVFKGGDPSLKANWENVGLNTNATLRRDEWKQLDAALIQVGRDRLGGIQDLVDSGLVYTLGNAMGSTVLEWHDVSDSQEAVITMDGITRSLNDTPVYGTNYLPIPIIHSDYEIGIRELSASRGLGNPLDVTKAANAARRVNEKLENMLFTNATYSFGEKDNRSRNSIYSYINHPDRNPVTLSVAWDNASKTAAQILADVVAMKNASIAAKKYGPWTLYIPTAYDSILDEDYSVSGASIQTIRDRVLKLDGITKIKVVDTLPANNVLLVQMTSDVVRLVRGMGIQNLEWAVEGGMLTKYKVMTIQVPQIRSDQNGNSGVTHLA